jgi:hypothetical protein
MPACDDTHRVSLGPSSCTQGKPRISLHRRELAKKYRKIKNYQTRGGGVRPAPLLVELGKQLAVFVVRRHDVKSHLRPFRGVGERSIRMKLAPSVLDFREPPLRDQNLNRKKLNNFLISSKSKL